MSAAERKSLDALIRDALTDSRAADPYAVVDAVLDAIPARLRAEYLREAIVARVPSVVARVRTNSTPAITPGRSVKQSLIRDEWWPSFLQQRVQVGDGWKFLADCTAGDLRMVAEMRRVKAQELLFRAEQFDLLADRMDAQGVAVLAELSEASASEVVERAA